MKSPHNFPNWLLTPLLLVNLGLFTTEMAWVWFLRQKSLVYTTFLFAAILTTFIAGSEQIYREMRAEALPTPPKFNDTKRYSLVDRPKALSVYSSLQGFIKANPPSTQLSLIAAEMAEWLGKPTDTKMLRRSAILADKLIECYSISTDDDRFIVKCEKPD